MFFGIRSAHTVWAENAPLFILRKKGTGRNVPAQKKTPMQKNRTQKNPLMPARPKMV